MDKCFVAIAAKEYTDSMKKYHIITLAILLSAPQVFAQEAVNPAAGQPVRKQMVQDSVSARQDMRNVATSTREEIRNMFEKQREAMRQKLEQSKKEAQDRREEFKKAVEEKRAEAKKRIEENRARLQDKLKSIRDEKKKAAVQTIDKRFEEINANRLGHFSNVLDQIEKVMQNVESRTAKAGIVGKNVSAVNADIVAVKAAISAARAAIVTQSAKTYPLVISHENALRTDVGKTRQALGADLKAVQDKVTAAREALRKAATDLAKIPGINDVERATPAATSTATTGTSTNQ